MPVIQSKYFAPVVFRNAHIATIYAATLRRVKDPCSQRERLELNDGDFIDLDWAYAPQPSENVIIAMHGLSGNARRPYMLGMAKIFTEAGWDFAGINFRSCSGPINRLFRSYNAGATEDLEEVITNILSKNRYKRIALVGFSLGGNLLLKYLGENKNIPNEIKSAIAISTPCNLAASLEVLQTQENRFYTKRFEKQLKAQLLERQLVFPDQLSRQEILSCNSLLAIDELYTSKAHGYFSAADYYEKCSCLQFLSEIKVPTLLLNAANDTFLSEDSYPRQTAHDSEALYLEVPLYGGHVGFIQHKRNYYQEERALAFTRYFSG